VGGVLGIQVVVLAASAPVAPVRGRDLEDLDAGPLQVAEQPGAVGAGRLDADAPEHPQGAHPGEHPLVAVPGGGEGPTAEDLIVLVDDGGDVEILVSIDAADDQ
jgi:hypothetical protein